jgi:hypothetical protein
MMGRSANTVVGVGWTEQVVATFKARARVTYGPLPSNLTAAVRELERRTSMAWGRLADVDEKIDDEIDRLDAADRELEARVRARIDQMDQQSQDVATSDVEVQIIGLGFIATGFLLQTFGMAFR